ncbi:hypothetical protein BDF22DRAFT_778967 [Syncephalis plumigaleata]|nr:hypothetical protein BDF22DRAFT_778967 [Syncephalis plumigaleata]
MYRQIKHFNTVNTCKTLGAHQLEPIREVRQRFPQLESLKEIGTFTNIRKLHCWEDHELALDHTTFAFGHAYEIEVETDTPEMLKEKLLALLKQHQIEHTDSTSNKFAIMMRNSL